MRRWFSVMLPTLWATVVMPAVTYVDATTANTRLQSGAALLVGSTCTSSAAEGAADGLWHLRTGVGNNGSVWSADESASGPEEVAPIVTTITLIEAGGYRLFAYMWDSDQPGENWDARVREGTSRIYKTIQAAEVEPASDAAFAPPIITTEGGRWLMQIPLGVVAVTAGATVNIYVDDDATIGARRTWYDGIGYEKVFGAIGERVVAIDFNKTNVPATPTQGMFRSVGGSSVSSQNSTSIVKHINACTVALRKSTPAPFDFRGANGDSTRVIPGGPTSMSFLLADFIGARDGTISVGFSNLAAGGYVFKSRHLDTFSSGNLGFAQGSTPTTPNTIRAYVNGSLRDIIQPTALGSAGLGTNFITDGDIPSLAFPFTSDGTNAVWIDLSSVYSNGVDRFILMNGLEVFSTLP